MKYFCLSKTHQCESCLIPKTWHFFTESFLLQTTITWTVRNAQDPFQTCFHKRFSTAIIAIVRSITLDNVTMHIKNYFGALLTFCQNNNKGIIFSQCLDSLIQCHGVFMVWRKQCRVFYFILHSAEHFQSWSYVMQGSYKLCIRTY